MAQIIKHTGGGKIIFDASDWTDGLLPNYGTSNSDNQKGQGLAAARSFHPFRRYGYALPGYAPTDVTNVSEVTQPVRSGVVNAGVAYMVCSNAKLQKLTISGSTLTASFHSISPHGGHLAVVGNDCVIYTHKVGGTSATRYLYSWSDDTDWDIGTFDFASTFDDDFMSTQPATPLASPYLTGGVGKPHPLIVGDDDILYIGDRNFVHAYDGQNADADGKFFPAVVTLPKGYIISSFARVRYGLMIFAYLENPSGGSAFYYDGKANAYLWNYNDLDITSSFDLTDNFVTEAFEYKGTVGCFTQGRPNDPSNTKISSLKLFDGSTFNTVAAFLNNPPIRGGVQTVGDVIYWNADGVVHSLGSPLFGTKSGLNKLSEGSGSTSGFFRFLDSSTMYVSSGATTSGGLQTLSGQSSFYHQTSFATGLAEPDFPAACKGKVENVKIRFGTACSGGRSLTLTIFDRDVASSTVINALTTVDATATVIKRVMDSDNIPFIRFDALKLVAVWGAGAAATAAPAISSVEVEYSEVSVD